MINADIHAVRNITEQTYQLKSGGWVTTLRITCDSATLKDKTSVNISFYSDEKESLEFKRYSKKNG
jgi:hypothetical protein